MRAFHHISCNYAGKIVKLLFTTYFTKFPSRVAELLEVSSSIVYELQLSFCLRSKLARVVELLEVTCSFSAS